MLFYVFVGFSADQFSQNDDPNVGNKVFLVSESDAEYSCAVHKDGCTETQIMCYTPKYVLFPSKYVCCRTYKLLLRHDLIKPTFSKSISLHVRSD
jgi:hypothetical protein